MPTPERPGYTYSIAQPAETAGPAESNNSSPVPIGLLLTAGLLIPGMVAYGMGTLNEMQVLAIVVGLLGVAAIVARPFVGLILFVVLLYTRPEEAIPALAGMHFTLLVAVVTLLGMVVQMLLDKQRPVQTPMNGMILCFGLAAMLSAAQTAEVVTGLMDIGRLVLLVFLVLNLTRTRDRYAILVSALLVVTAYLALFSIYLFHTGSFIVQDGQMRSKATGIFGDPNDLAATFVAGIALAVMRILQTRGAQRLAYVGIVGILLYAAVISNSRGGFLALVALAVGYFLIAKIPTKTKIAWAVVATILLMGVSAGRMSNFDTKEASANSRFWFWSNGVDMLLSHPILGVGYQEFGSGNSGMTAHNSFVLCFAELGLAGYISWVGVIYCGFKPRNKQAIASAASADEENLFAARMALGAYLAASFWLSHTYSPILYVFLALPVAAQLSTGAPGAPEPGAAKAWWRDFGRAGAIAVCSILVIKTIAEHYR